MHLATVALALVVGATLVPVIRSPDVAAVVANVFLVSVWWPDWWQAGNPVSWSLCCEAFFYLMFPLLAALVVRSRSVLLPAAVALAGVYAAPLLVDGLVSPGSASHHPLARVPEFVLGIVVAVAIRSGRWRGPRWQVAMPVAVAGYVLADTLPHSTVSTAGYTAPGFALLIGALARADLDGRGTWLARPRLVRLGEVSYAFYLVHLLVIASVSSPWPDGHPGLPVPGAVGLAVAALVGATALAWVLHVGVEVPVRRRLLRVGTRRDALEPHRRPAGSRNPPGRVTCRRMDRVPCS